MPENKSQGQNLQEELLYRTKNAWSVLPEEKRSEVEAFCEDYKVFLNHAKTEREFVSEAERIIREKGFVSLEEITQSGKRLSPGMKVYRICRKKSMLLGIIGSKPLGEGLNVLGAHIDSPRIDVKQNPLYEEAGLGMLKTHYYGLLKKYQWVTIPLAVHGVMVKANGETVPVCIGESEEDPVFTITDLLPHLAADQMQKKAAEVITGEGLNLLMGSIPYTDENIQDRVKLNILRLLNERYGVTGEDFISAELEIVPAFKARDVGIDRSMIGGYGQDDRVCAYGVLRTFTDVADVDKTAVCVLTDKEEIGNVGNTGAVAMLLKNFVAALHKLSGSGSPDTDLADCLAASKMLSCDVISGVDPNHEGVQDSRNAAYMGKGVVVQKYTGARGKSGGNDANAEFLGELRKLFNDNKIIWQAGELGRVDLGGGGTISQYLSDLGMEVVDCGIALLSMHSPFEVTSKIDVFINYESNKAFLRMP